MQIKHQSPDLTLVWLVLLATTATSWLLSGLDGHDMPAADRVSRLAIIAIAFFKTRLVSLHFMEIAEAPWALRIAIEAWCLVTCALLMVQFW